MTLDASGRAGRLLAKIAVGAEMDEFAELDAMRKIGTVLNELDEDARQRVFDWVSEKYDLSRTTKKKPPAHGGEGDVSQEDDRSGADFDAIADLFYAASPNTDADKVLVAGYWFQFCLGQSDLESQAINTELKNLGHGIGNITRAFSSLTRTKPQLLIQTRKDGNSKQARKKFKITDAGRRQVDRMIRGDSEGDDA